MSKRFFTVMVIPDRDSRTRNFRVPHRAIYAAASAAGLLVLAVVGLGLHLARVVDHSDQNRLLRDENNQLRAQLRLVQEKVAHIDATLDRVERFDQRLRSLTSLNDAERNLAIGPLDPPERGSSGEEGGHDVGLLDEKLDSLVDEAVRSERSLAELQRYFEDQKSLLASTPSIWPARGWVTSDFGSRLDPYTAHSVMHKGLDIANRSGSPVYAPADGVVVFAGTEGGYGKLLVLDHGYGVKTRFGHLSDVLAKVGQRVKRGEQIAAMGNTGRSTGPHLHYEVRVNGIPENPRKFILE
ncbi:MAG TPA: peptidoglycan DD-metalloendopeptidase family protein [Vulgatibacter sp.]|nr:peptidoglycan DD-metalloendopeptidase family protein [Vulgatibacter sp.]